MDERDELLRRRAARERLARKAAEAIIEEKSRELYAKGQALEAAVAAETLARREAETLRDALEAFTSGLHADDILRHLADFLERLVAHDGCAIYAVEGDTLRLRTTCPVAAGEAASAGYEAPPELFADVRRASRPIVVKPAAEMVEHARAWDLPLKGPNLMVVPMYAHGRTTGCLALGSARDNAFDDAAARLAQALANEAALALENARLFAEVERLSEMDALTGLHNRRHFARESAAEWERCRRHRLRLSAIMLDIDHFKRFNDTYGHATGDRVLVEVANVCRRTIRMIDMDVRYGGEEFCFLLPETGIEDAAALAARLHDAVARMRLESDEEPLAVTVSIGVAERSEDDPVVDALLRRADAALYQAKGQGRDRIVTAPAPNG